MQRSGFLVSTKNLSQKIGSWRWWLQWCLGQKCANLPQLWCHPQKLKVQNFSIEKKLNKKTSYIFRGFQQLSSTIG